MLLAFRNWMAPPLIDDHERSQMRNILWLLQTWQVLIGLGLIVAFGLQDESGWTGVLFALHGLVCAGLTLGGLFFSPRVTAPILWYAAAVYLCVEGHGIHDVTVSLFPLTMVGAAALTGRRGLAIFWAACIVGIMCMVYAETSGILVTRLSQRTDVLDFGYLAVIYSVIGGTLWILLGYWNALLQRAKRNESELSKQRNALEASEARFRAIADYTFSWESWIGLDGNLLWVNPAVERVTGYTVQECLDMKNYPVPLVHKSDHDRMWELFRSAAKGAVEDETEFRIQRKDGEVSWGAISWRPISDPTGADAGYRSTVRDITDRKRADEKHAELEKQLERSQRMEAIGQLAGGIAHDFNNLLLAIRGNAELLLDGAALKTEDTPLATEISKAADRAAQLTSQLLAFSRRQVIQPVPTDINELIGDLIALLTRLIPEDIDLRFRPKATSSIIAGDPAHIEQIIVNLVLNARDAMPNGGKLVIETYNASKHSLSDGHNTPVPGECLVIRVCDTGTGMTPDVRDHIFEPFFTTKPTGKGTGLGLSTVFGLVKQHSGVTRVQSEVDVGTEFKVFFPLTSEPIRTIDPGQTAPREAGHETILVVEDEPMVLKLACTILEGAGYTTIRCINGQEAYDCYLDRGSEIDLVLSDVVMPVMGGEEVMRHLVEIDPSVRILFSSGYVGEGIHTDFILNGGFELLSKPYGPDELLRKVRSALRSGSGLGTPKAH